MHGQWKKHVIQVENIQHQLKKNLGLNIQIQSIEMKTYSSNLTNKKMGFFRMYTEGLIHRPLMNLASFTTSSHLNHTNWSNEEYDSLIKKYPHSSRKEQKKIGIDALKIFTNKVPVIPLYVSARSYLVSNRTKGFEHSPYNHCQYQFVSFR